MIFLFDGVALFLTIFLIITLADLLIMFIRYRIEMDEWRYPIDMVKFREWMKRQENEKKD